MSAVTWTRQKFKFAINLSWEKDCISVKWKEWIFNSCKCLEILCLRHTNCSSVEILTPDNIIGVFYFYESWIVCINRHKIVSVFIFKRYLVFFKIPVNCIITLSKINIWNSICLFSTEHSYKSIFIRHNCTVENSCNSRCRISSDDWIFIKSPERKSCLIVCRSLLPWHIWYIWSDNFYVTHIYSSVLLISFNY